jgi:tetratricopeptide (TPR) repeat protein/transcriptional regulator with XRE-family HTH domain
MIRWWDKYLLTMRRSLRLSPKGTVTVRQAIALRGLTQQGLADQVELSRASVAKFLRGNPVDRRVFAEICNFLEIDWEMVVLSEESVGVSDLGAPSQICAPALSVYNPETWVGRSSIIDELLLKLQDKTRLVWITGIPGIGKTTLGECLASRAWESNPTFQWIYLEVLEGQGADFTTVAADLLAKLGDRDLDPQERNDPKRLTDRLIRKLQSSFYWVQLDSLERLLSSKVGNNFADSHWVIFFQRCLSEQSFASRLVLTARTFPCALVEFLDRYPNFWIEQTLTGLSADEQHSEYLEFFSKHGLVINENNRTSLYKLGSICEGHTLALQVISGQIQANFGGDVARYWAVNQKEFERMAQTRESKQLDETEYDDELDRRVRERIKRSLQQLPPDAQDLLLRSSVYRCPVPKKFWLSMIDDRDSSQQKEAYRVLSNFGLIEKKDTRIRQHNLIRSVSYDLLKSNTSIWKQAEQQAAHLWLTAYRAIEDAPDLETARGYLEAFYHYCEIGDWDTAINLPYMRLETGNILHEQLLIWGYFRELIPLHSKLLEIAQMSDTKQAKGDALRNMGNVYNSLGQHKKAIEYYQKSLEISQEIDDLYGAGRSLGNLGNIYSSLGRYEQALRLLEENLMISEQISDVQGVSKALGNLGILHAHLGNYVLASDYHQRTLVLAKQIGDRQGESSALGNLGILHHYLGEDEQAIDYYQENLSIAREIGDRQGQGIALVNIGKTKFKLNCYDEAMIYAESALVIFQEIGAKANAAETFKNLAELSRVMGRVEDARVYCQQALILASELDIPLADDCRQLMAQLG